MKSIPVPFSLPVLAMVALVACDDPRDQGITGPIEPIVVSPPRPHFSAQPSVEVTDLGTLGGGTFHLARSINNQRHVVGISSTATGDTRAFLWTPAGGLVDLGTTGGSSATAHAISESGFIAGMSLDGAGLPEAVLWQPNLTIQGLGQFGGFSSAGFGVNDQGQVVGWYAPWFDPLDPPTFRGTQAFVWSAADGFLELPTLGNPFEGYAWDINNDGQVVGSSSVTADSTSPFLAYIWSPTEGLQSLGTMGPDYSEHDAFSINDQGNIAGGAINDVDGRVHPFTWSPGGGLFDMTFGFPPGTSAFGIDVNILGHVAVLLLKSDGTNAPAVWVKNVGVVEFPTLGGVNGDIWAINDLGVLAGWSETAAGEMRPVTWRLVFSADDRVQDVIDAIDDMLPGVSGDVADELEDAIDELNDALDELAESPPDLGDGIEDIADAAEAIEDAIQEGLDPTIGNALMEILAEAARELAVEAIDDAIARGGDPGEIADAQAFLAQGDVQRAAGNYSTAIDEYRDAAKDAEDA